MSLPRHLETKHPQCPQCGGRCEMFVEHGVRGDFQVIHCADVYDCCWYWVPDGAETWPHEPGYHRDNILARAGYTKQTLTERGQVTGALAGWIAALLDEEPQIDTAEVYFERIIERGRLDKLVGIAFAIRKSRALCKCTMKRLLDVDERGRVFDEGVMTQTEFEDHMNHDERCPVGAALEIIAHAHAL